MVRKKNGVEVRVALERAVIDQNEAKSAPLVQSQWTESPESPDMLAVGMRSEPNTPRILSFTPTTTRFLVDQSRSVAPRHARRAKGSEQGPDSTSPRSHTRPGEPWPPTAWRETDAAVKAQCQADSADSARESHVHANPSLFAVLDSIDATARNRSISQPTSSARSARVLPVKEQRSLSSQAQGLSDTAGQGSWRGSSPCQDGTRSNDLNQLSSRQESHRLSPQRKGVLLASPEPDSPVDWCMSLKPEDLDSKFIGPRQGSSQMRSEYFRREARHDEVALDSRLPYAALDSRHAAAADGVTKSREGDQTRADKVQADKAAAAGDVKSLGGRQWVVMEQRGQTATASVDLRSVLMSPFRETRHRAGQASPPTSPLTRRSQDSTQERGQRRGPASQTSDPDRADLEQTSGQLDQAATEIEGGQSECRMLDRHVACLCSCACSPATTDLCT